VYAQSSKALLHQENTVSITSLASLRQFPESLRPQLHVAYAAAREALVATHQAQAVRFTQEFSRRLPPLEALDLYFRVVPVPQSMIESIVSRALVELDFDRLPQVAAAPSLFSTVRVLRLDLTLSLMRRRRHHMEATLQLARLAGARAADAVLDTHVLNAARIAEILHHVVWVDDAVSHYIHTFRLSLATAYMVFQRTRAMMADRNLSELLDTVTEPAVLTAPALAIDRRVRIAG
jgi:hypothetical protein